MKTVYLRVFGVLALAGAVGSCGGGNDDDSELLTGIFSDSPVAGLTYTTPSVSGVTDADGMFSYREGETVVFSIGNLALPVVAAAEMVTPLDMVSTTDVTDPEVVNIARLLQSLDEDANPDNGISIPEESSDIFVETEVFDAESDAAVVEMVDRVYGDRRAVVTSEQALTHFVSTLSANANSDASLDQLHYIVPAGGPFIGDSLYVDENNFSLAVDGEVHTGSTSVNQGVYQLSGADEFWFVSVSESEQNKLACIDKAPVAVTECSGDLYHVFKDEQQALDFGAIEETNRGSGELPSAAELVTGAATDEQDINAAPSIGAAGLENAEETNSQSSIQPEEVATVIVAEQVAGEVDLESLFPRCDVGTVDDNGDGYGWQDSRSCLIVVEQVPAAVQAPVEAPVTTDTPAAVSTPAPVEAPAVEAPVIEAPAEVETPVVVEAPAIVESPVAAEVPEVVESSAEPAPPVVLEQPVAAQQSSVPEATEAEQTPAVTEVPTPDEAPVEVETPAVVDAPVEVETPVVAEAPTVSEAPAVAPTPDVTEAPVTVAESGPQLTDITDIIVLTGQSNAAAVQTGFDATLDAGHERLFAFSEAGEWQTADLDQYWDNNLPSNFAYEADGRTPFNNLVFQVGKSLTEQTDRVVGIILITAPGEGISHWDYNSDFYRKIRAKVTNALSQLPQKTSVDAMIWMQGETDWLAEGTADPNATGFASTDSDFYRNYYPNKLDQLINNLRSEVWFEQSQFICGETKRTDLNHHLMALNNDGDDLTSCAQASDLPTRTNDPFGNHYSADGLRTLGDRIAALYLSR